MRHTIAYLCVMGAAGVAAWIGGMLIHGAMQ